MSPRPTKKNIKYKYKKKYIYRKNPHGKNVYNPSKKNSCLIIYPNILFHSSARHRQNHDMVK